MNATLALDIGTTNVKCILYQNGQLGFVLFFFELFKLIKNPYISTPLNKTTKTIHIIRDEPDQAEINPDQLWNIIRSSLSESLDYAQRNDLKVSNLGISTHRSTCTIWETNSGRGKGI